MFIDHPHLKDLEDFESNDLDLQSQICHESSKLSDASLSTVDAQLCEFSSCSFDIVAYFLVSN